MQSFAQGEDEQCPVRYVTRGGIQNDGSHLGNDVQHAVNVLCESHVRTTRSDGMKKSMNEYMARRIAYLSGSGG